MNKLNLALLLLFSLSLWACGGEEKMSLEDKKQKLTSLRQEADKLQAEIDTEDVATTEVRKIPVKTTTLQAKTFKHFLKVKGQVESNKNVLLSSRTSGTLLSLRVKEGQMVSRGQTLGELDHDVMDRSRDELQTQLDLATILFEKQKRLWDQEIGTEVQFLQFKTNKEGLERKMATLDEQIAMSKIKSPISGMVDEILPKVGEMVSPGRPAFRIVSPRDLSLTAQLAESYIPFVKKGDEVVVNFPLLDKSIKARVTSVGQTVDPTSRTFKVEVKLPTDRSLKMNMFGELAINDRQTKDAISVPIHLLQHTETGSFVFVAEKDGENMIARRRMLTIGLNQDGEVHILEGLKAGDMLISNGYSELSDGQAISL